MKNAFNFEKYMSTKIHIKLNVFKEHLYVLMLAKI